MDSKELIHPNDHQDPHFLNLDEQQKRRLMNYYIFVTFCAGLLVPYSVRVIALALGILQNTYHLKDFAWLSLPFIYLSFYLARKKSQWDVKMFVTMWLMAMQTAYIIYLIAGLYMEAHELEGRRISGVNFSPRNVLIFVLLPFSYDLLHAVGYVAHSSFLAPMGVKFSTNKTATKRSIAAHFF